MKRATRRGSIIAIVSVITMAALAACSPATSTGSGADEPIKVRVGYNGDGNGAMLEAIAEDQKLWEKHGLEADVKQFTNGPLQIQALGTGDLDFGFIGPGALWLPMSGKAKIVAIEALGTADRVIAQPGISSVEDLKGKTIGVPEGTSGDMLLSMALAKAGMTVEDVNKVAMDPPTVIAAFTAGQIDAAAIWYPFVGEIKTRAEDLVEVVKSEDFPDLAFPSSLVAANDITEKPEMLARFQGVVKDAMAWAADNPGKLPQLLSDYLGVPLDSVTSEFEFVNVLEPSDLIEQWESGVAPKWFENLNAEFIEMGKVDQMVDPTTYILFDEYASS